MTNAHTPVSLRSLTARARTLLRERGRDDLADRAFDAVHYTDDGTTLYVHIFARPSWPQRRPGQAYALAFADHTQLSTLADHRELLREAGLLLEDEIADIEGWFEGR